MKPLDTATIPLTAAPAPILGALVNATDFGKLLGVTPRTFSAWNNAGRIGPAPVMTGRRAMWSREEIELWLRERDARGELFTRTTWPAARDAITAIERKGRRRAVPA